MVDQLLLIAKSFVALSVIIMAFIMLVKDVRFQPRQAHSTVGRLLSWSGRVGLATIALVSFSHFLDIYMDSGYHTTRDLALLAGIAMLLAKPLKNVFASEELESFTEPRVGRKVFGIGIGYAAVIAATMAFFSFGPKIEQHYFPINTNIVYDNIVRSPDHVCWTTSYTKIRDAKVVYAIYLVRNKDNKSFDTTVTRLEKNTTALIDRKPGEVKSTLCAVIPEEIRNEQGLTVIGEAKYETHNLWPFFHDIGPIPVPDDITD